jgi:hypothetical protein
MIVTDLERTDSERLVSVVVPGVLGTRETLFSERWIGVCGSCERPASALVWRLVNKQVPAARSRDPRLASVAAQPFQDEVEIPSMGNVFAPCRRCGEDVRLIAIRGRRRDAVPCDVRCTSAKGSSCECSCGGANHGSDWS